MNEREAKTAAEFDRLDVQAEADRIAIQERATAAKRTLEQRADVLRTRVGAEPQREPQDGDGG